MDIKELAVLGRERKYKEIIELYNQDSSLLDDAGTAQFVAESYEECGDLDNAAKIYEHILKEYEEESAAEHLVDIYKVTDNADALQTLADSLEESCVSDSSMLMARYEILRIQAADMDEQLDALIEFVDTYYDDVYGILLVEELMKNGDIDKAKRYASKFRRRYSNSEYDSYLQELEAIAETGSYTKPEHSITSVIYAHRHVNMKSSEGAQHTENVANTNSVTDVAIDVVSEDEDASEKKETPKTRIKTRGLGELISGGMLDSMVTGTNTKNAEPPSVEDRFANIVGMASARVEIGRVYRVYKLQMEREDANFNANMLDTTHFAICGKRGSGKTLLAETVGQILADFGIRGSEEAVTVEAKDFNDSISEALSLKDVTLIVENIDKAVNDQGKYGDFAWNMRKYLKEKKATVSVIMTGTKEAISSLFQEEKEILEMIYSELHIEDYKLDELVDIMKLMVKQAGWKMTEDAEALVRKQLSQEMKMLNFAGSKAIAEKIKAAQKRAADRFDLLEDIDEKDMVYLEAEDFQKDGIKASVPELLEQLQSLVGLDSVKKVVSDLVNMIMVQKEADKVNSERKSTSSGMHMVFKGAPGTGKTTVARIIGEIYQALGVLPGNKEGFIECSSADLIGQVVGESENKVKDITDRAMGGVLFIDEAYALTNNQFGQQAIDTLVPIMENSRDSLMVILAGYSEDMDRFLDVNAGLRSRISTHIIFEDYSEQEMVAIFKSMVSNDRRYLDKDTGDLVAELIAQRSKVRDFGNARGVRGLVALVEKAQDMRISDMIVAGNVPSTNDYEIIRKEDIEAVIYGDVADDEPLDKLRADLNNLEGLEALKEVINENIEACEAANRRKEMGVGTSVRMDNLHMVFMGGPGTGKTTTARKIGKIYKALGILPRGDVLIECSRPELVADHVGGTAKLVKEKIDSAMGGVLFIDEAYTLSRDVSDTFGREAIDTLVKSMEDYRGRFMIILAGYPDEMNHFLDMNPGLRSRIGKNIIPYDDFSLEQLVSIFKKFAEAAGFTLGEGTESLVRTLIDSQSKQKDYGNARGVRNTWEQVVKAINKRILSAEDNAQADSFTTVLPEDIQYVMDREGINTEEEETVDELLAELNSMIGLQSVKEAVNSIVEEAKYNKWAKENGMADAAGHGSLHLLFKGNAGTGKTTVARMLGKIYAKLGVLRTGQCIECGRSELVAGYVGQTAAKTKEYIQQAKGGILFVDEAYTLNKGGENDFGQEALETIMTAMENNRDDLMVIFAGYSDELDALIATNQGLESRFSKDNEIIFEDYTDDELLQIFIFQAKKSGMVVGEEVYPYVLERIRQTRDNAKNFGNARDIRNIVETANRARKKRIMQEVKADASLSPDYAVTLKKEDLGL